jgi:hypothetical protein
MSADFEMPPELAAQGVNYGVDLVPKEGAPGSATATFAAITNVHLAMMSESVRELAEMEMVAQNTFLSYKLRDEKNAPGLMSLVGESSLKRMRVE